MGDSELFETPNNFKEYIWNVRDCWEVFETLWLPILSITIGLYYYYRPIFVNSSHNYMKMIHLRYCLFWSFNCMYDERTEILLSW